MAGIECKKLDDFVSSHSSRRLARQLRVMRDVVDVPCLLIRDYRQEVLELVLARAEGRNSRYRANNFWADLIRYQNSGITLLFGPSGDEEMVEYLQAVRKTLGQGESVGAFMGTDKKRGK